MFSIENSTPVEEIYLKRLNLVVRDEFTNQRKIAELYAEIHRLQEDNTILKDIHVDLLQKEPIHKANLASRLVWTPEGSNEMPDF